MAVGAAWKLGYDAGLRAGYRAGARAGEVRAARAGPPEVRDQRHALAALSQTAAWKALGRVPTAEAVALSDLLNRAPAPCFEQARRGRSLASVLLDPGSACSGAEQARLALVALRSFGPDSNEALAVLRVERRVSIATQGRPSRGNPDADVVLVEWGDFQCPYCAQVQPLLRRLLARRSDVRLVFKHLPLSFHRAAMPAALAAEAAGTQGKFWEMHDALLGLGQKIVAASEASQATAQGGPVAFEELAVELALDVARYRADYRSPETRRRVEADIAEADRVGITATPTLVIDTRQVEEGFDLPLLERLIDKARAEREWRFSWDLEEAANDAPARGPGSPPP